MHDQSCLTFLHGYYFVSPIVAREGGEAFRPVLKTGGCRVQNR